MRPYSDWPKTLESEHAFGVDGHPEDDTSVIKALAPAVDGARAQSVQHSISTGGRAVGELYDPAHCIQTEIAH